MLKTIKRSTLKLARSCGILERVKNSRWRRNRLLLLCYHGISQQDEHEWRPTLYMPADLFRQRLESLRKDGYTVLPLAEALRRLYGDDLRPGSVVLTFDDGGCDFYRIAYPLVQSYGFPATVYQSTYYCDYPKPIFNLVCSYMLWKRRGKVLQPAKELGLKQVMDLRTEAGRQSVVSELMLLSARENRTGAQKNDLAESLASFLEIDFGALVSSRLLQLMTPAEISELAARGVDFQMHTHRHRLPEDRTLFQREIRENRERIKAMTGQSSVHFCYPLGRYQPRFVRWLAEEGVVSAATCDSGLASAASDALLLPRFVDTTSVSPLEFESWLSGVGSVLSRQHHPGWD